MRRGANIHNLSFLAIAPQLANGHPWVISGPCRIYHLVTWICHHQAMIGTQATKGFGLLFAIVGIPLILWNASGANSELAALDASSSTESARIEACEAKAIKLEPNSSARRQLCGCIVEKASERGAFKDYGAYDEGLLEPIVGECMRGS